MRTQIAVFVVALSSFAGLTGDAAARHQQVEMPGIDKARGAYWEDAGGSHRGRYGCTKQCAPMQACTVTCERNGRCIVQLPTDETGAVSNGINVQQFVLGFAIASPR